MLKPITFYLPQFHTIPENDAWWGKGFTEWNNVQNAQALFEGHYQPHVPHKSIGYYSLHDPNFLIKQHQMAKRYGIFGMAYSVWHIRYGIFGMAYYLYWFNGKTLLEEPLTIIRNEPRIQTAYCLNWANAPWTRAWFGQNKEILIHNEYSEENALAFIRYIAPYFDDPRYIRIDNKPLLLVYEPEAIPVIRSYSRIWRDFMRERGFDGITLASVEALSIGTHPNEYGFDMAVEFAPDWSQTHKLSSPDEYPRRFDYARTVQNMLQKALPPYIRYRCIFPSWDNTPRYKGAAITFTGANLGAFRYFAEYAARFTKEHFPKDKRYLFINAWNEWEEGCHLEPDEKNGFGYLQVLAEGLRAAESTLNALQR